MLRERGWQNDEMIFNMDQTGLPVELLPTKVVAKKGAKKVNAKAKQTGFLLARAYGKKFKLMLVYRAAAYQAVLSRGSYNKWTKRQSTLKKLGIINENIKI